MRISYPYFKSKNITVDYRKFDKTMRKAVKDNMMGAARGMAKAAKQLMWDAVYEYPQCPLKPPDEKGEGGKLRASGSAFVNNVLQDTTAEYKPEQAQPMRTRNDPIDKMTFLGIVVFNTFYAAKTHEMGPGTKWGTPGTGPKWLETKLYRNKDQYYGIVADAILHPGKHRTPWSETIPSPFTWDSLKRKIEAL